MLSKMKHLMINSTKCAILFYFVYECLGIFFIRSNAQFNNAIIESMNFPQNIFQNRNTTANKINNDLRKRYDFLYQDTNYLEELNDAKPRLSLSNENEQQDLSKQIKKNFESNKLHSDIFQILSHSNNDASLMAYFNKKKNLQSDLVPSSFIPVLIKKLIKRPKNQIDVTSSSLQNQSLPFNFYSNFLNHNVWVVPIFIISICLGTMYLGLEVLILSKSIRRGNRKLRSVRRVVFLDQMLLLGIFLCCFAAMSNTLIASSIPVCILKRTGPGIAYALVYSTLLVKLVFINSLNSGVHLSTTYQFLLFCFAFAVQVVISVQGTILQPSKIVKINPLNVQVCSFSFEDQLMELSYIIILILVVTVFAFKSRDTRENYKEAMYIGVSMSFTLCIFIAWILSGLMLPVEFSGLCIASGLLACSFVTFIIMLIPKKKQWGRSGSLPSKKGGNTSTASSSLTAISNFNQSTSNSSQCLQKVLPSHNIPKTKSCIMCGQSDKTRAPDKFENMSSDSSVMENNSLIFHRQMFNRHQDLHTANEARASRSDLRQLRENLFAERQSVRRPIVPLRFN